MGTKAHSKYLSLTFQILKDVGKFSSSLKVIHREHYNMIRESVRTHIFVRFKGNIRKIYLKIYSLTARLSATNLTLLTIAVSFTKCLQNIKLSAYGPLNRTDVAIR